MSKRIISFALVLCMVMSLITVVPVHAATVTDGISFGYADEFYAQNIKSGDDLYYMSQPFSNAPHTYEVWMCFPETPTEASVVFGNKHDGMDAHISCELNTKGQPIFRYADFSGSTYKTVFTEVNVYTGDWVHLAIVHDPDTNMLKCYQDGALKGERAFYPDYDPIALRTPLCIGGDCEYQNNPHFKGRIKEVSIFSDARTASEILSDCENGVDLTDENLLVSYDMTADKEGCDIADLSANGNDLIYSNLWLTVEEVEAMRSESDFERAYSFAVIGDTQYTTEFYPENLDPMYQWIADNKDEHNIVYSIGLGDITNRDTYTEWDRAKAAISILDGVVPYAIIRGNHDLKNYSASANNSYDPVNLGKQASTIGHAFDEYFAVDTDSETDYIDQFIHNGSNGGVFEEGSVMNTWRILEVANSKWLLLNLDYAASDIVLDWASDIVEAHPDHKVIVSTHSYLAPDGTHTDAAGYAGEKDKAGVCVPADAIDVNLGVDIWEKFTSQHENIQIVLSGHYSSPRLTTVQREGKNGNTVTEILVDGQAHDNRYGGLGLVAMLYFNADGSEVEVENYSVTVGKYYRGINCFSIDLNAEGEPYDAVSWNGLAKAPEGKGTVTDPYLISSAGNLRWMSEQIQNTSGGASFQNKYFKQTNDIDLCGNYIKSIGYYYESDNNMYAFGGVYDGNGYSIKNGNIVGKVFDGEFNKAYGYGLFGMLYGGTVKNVVLDNVTVVGRGVTGMVVGKTSGTSGADSDEQFNLVSNCEVKSNCKLLTLLPEGKSAPTSTAIDGVNHAGIVGGIVGMARSATVEYCVNNMPISVTGTFGTVGGVVGAAGYNTVITNCGNNGAITLVDGNSAREMMFGGVLGMSTAMTITTDVADNKAGSLQLLGCFNTAKLSYSGATAPTVGTSFGGIIGMVGNLHPIDTTTTRPAVGEMSPYLMDNCHNSYALKTNAGSTSTDPDVTGGLIGKGIISANTANVSTMWLQYSSSVAVTRRYAGAGVKGYNTFSYINYNTKYGFKPIAVVSNIEGNAVTSGDSLKASADVVKAAITSITDTIAYHKADIATEFSWTVDTDTGNLSIYGNGVMPDYTAGTAPWYEYSDIITSVEIGSGISNIGDYAFYNCSALTDVYVANIADVGKYAFENTAFINDSTDDLVYVGDVIVKANARTDNTYTFYTNTKAVAENAFKSITADKIYYGFNTGSFNSIVVEAGNESIDISVCQHVCRGDAVYWEFFEDTGLLAINGSGVMEDYGSSAARPWERFIDDIISVNITNGITHIGDRVFRNHTSLKSVYIPEGVTSIGTGAFERTSLTELTLPSTLTSMKNWVFVGTAIETVTIPESLTSLGTYIFYECTSLKNVYLPQTLTAIGANSFRGCTALETVYYDGSKSQFTAITVGINNTPLTDAKLVCSVVEAELEWSYDTATSTLSVAGVLPSYTQGSAPWYQYVSSAKTLKLAKDVTSIGANAFYGFDFDTVYYASTSADFALVTISDGNDILSPDNTQYVYEGDAINWLFDESTGTLSFFGSGAMTNYATGTTRPWQRYISDVKMVVIGDGITTVGDRIFINHTNLTTVTLPEGIVTIGTGAFQQSGLTAIEIPSTVTTMKNWVFVGTPIKSITIPSSLTSLGTYVFSNCTSLEEIHLPVTIKSIGANCFNNCTALDTVYYDGIPQQYQTITVGDNNSALYKDTLTVVYSYNYGYSFDEQTGTLTISGSGNMHDFDSETLTPWYSYKDSVTSIVVEKSITNIGNHAFRNFANVTSVSLPDGIITIGKGAFQSTSLTQIRIPDTVTSIGNYAFYATDFETVKIPSGITWIGNNVFRNNTALKSVYLPDTITEVRTAAFDGCTSLTDVYYTGTEAQFNSITVVDATTKNVYFTNATKHYNYSPVITGTAGANATYSFDPDTAVLTITGTGTLWSPGLEAAKRPLVKEVVIEGLTSISANIFSGAHFTSLEKVTLPEGITSLGKGAFTDCKKLSDINLPSSLKSIGELCFYNCKALTKIDIPENVTSIGNSTFLGVVASDINFAGTRAMWDAVTIGTDNARLSFVACSDDYRVILDKATKGDGAWIFNEANETLYFAGNTNYIKSYAEGAEMVPAEIAVKVKYIDIDETLGGFGAYTFSNMTNVISVTGGENIRYVGNYAFKNCTSLKTVEFTNSQYFGGIPYGLFANCTSLETVELSDSIVFLYGASFQGCSSLKEITIPASAKAVGEYTFRNCTALETITLHEGITSFGAGAIQGCSNLKNINFPSTLNVIGIYAFYNVPSTLTVNFNGTQSQWNTVYVREGNTTLISLTVNCK